MFCFSRNIEFCYPFQYCACTLIVHVRRFLVVSIFHSSLFQTKKNETLAELNISTIRYTITVHVFFQSTIDDYEDMPVDQFGAAMLKGMGWKPGEAIGLNKKGLVITRQLTMNNP